ncbi:glycosyltransferase family 4 protein [Methylobacter psychrophilus]|uniref:glycosyltransferase family 4 protein n=1 Tax=Methylobacter psychrophilus TaxID=96941 RepID=UPI0021D4D406|nr:glycosyltransferase family 1 protein [Methylobacter psychrophilus]
MKLILAVDALSPPLSGIGRYTWELASRIGHVQGIEQVRYFRNGEWIDDPTSLLGGASPSRKRYYNLPRWAKDWYWQQTCRGNVFHGPNFFLPPYAENGIVTVHDLSVFKFPETHPVARLREFDKLFQRTLDSAVHLITVSETTRQEIIDYLDWPAEKITAIHNGVSALFAPQTSEILMPFLSRYGLRYGGYILCVSTIEPRKRIDALLDAYNQLPASLRAIYPLVLVGGKGWRSESLHEQIERGQNAGWLHYLGYVPEADLPALYAGARLFVYPSIYEGFGLPVIEAMASGVPVLTSNRSCLPEVAAGAAMLINPDDMDALTIGLEEGLIDSEWREKAIACGLKVAARYDWAECVKQTAAVYVDGFDG